MPLAGIKPGLFVSRCLLGHPVRYNGSSASLPSGILEKLDSLFQIIPICPEIEGGLPVPREPSEIRDNCVFSASGKDWTTPFENGAECCLKEGKDRVFLALLKENSPSCGSSWIYDGSFSGKKVHGQGITAALFRLKGISVYSEAELEELFSCSSSKALSR